MNCLQCFDAVRLVARRASGLQKKLSGGCWHGCLSGARCRLAYATHRLFFSKIHICFTFLVPADPSSPGQMVVKQVMFVVTVILISNLYRIQQHSKDMNTGMRQQTLTVNNSKTNTRDNRQMYSHRRHQLQL